MHIENDRLILRIPDDCNLAELKAMREDKRIYRYELVYLTELQNTPEEALKTIRNLNLQKDRMCILGIYEKSHPDDMVDLAELYDYKPYEKVISLGYRISPANWCKGIATCCMASLLVFIRSSTQVEFDIIPQKSEHHPVCLIRWCFDYYLELYILRWLALVKLTNFCDSKFIILELVICSNQRHLLSRFRFFPVFRTFCA